MLSRTKKNFVFEVFRTFNTTSRIDASHYDVLGITPRATQNDIKSAYYKLSKLYHPDKSKDEESAKRFRAITEAYEVLGNIKLKKMYDKGLLVGRDNMRHTDYKPEEEPTDPTLKFYKSHKTRNIVPTMDGKTPIYDFDTWSKHHYGNLLKKSRDEKEFVKMRKQRQADSTQAVNQELTLYIMFAIGALSLSLVVYGTHDYDVDITAKKNSVQSEASEQLDKQHNR